MKIWSDLLNPGQFYASLVGQTLIIDFHLLIMNTVLQFRGVYHFPEEEREILAEDIKN